MNFKKIIEEKKSYIKSVISKITPENDEDLEQEVYIKIWKNAHKYKEKGKFNAWINTITANITKDYLKKTKNYKFSNNEILTSIPDTKPSPENTFNQKLRQKRIINAIKNLKKNFREIIIMYEFEGKSYEEISKKIKCPLGTVKSRFYNPKKILPEEVK